MKFIWFAFLSLLLSNSLSWEIKHFPLSSFEAFLLLLMTALAINFNFSIKRNVCSLNKGFLCSSRLKLLDWKMKSFKLSMSKANCLLIDFPLRLSLFFNHFQFWTLKTRKAFQFFVCLTTIFINFNPCRTNGNERIITSTTKSLQDFIKDPSIALAI